MPPAAATAITKPRIAIAVITRCPSCGRKVGAIPATDLRCPHRTPPRRVT
jgi:hypothetical protein